MLRKSLLTAVALLLIGCASPTSSVPRIPLTLSGGGTYAAKAVVKITANPTYSGTGTLTYEWHVGDFKTTDKGDYAYFSATSATTSTITATVTDGTAVGTATTTIIYQ